ncbi:natural resistance-associated macrophage protein [Hyaloscypha bicolor E]|uniref:Natural resistance-associated macrophage protein n=1 Tax=Hyaloscypha bicolor E TaxID=1095630 RepID=A0A2J6T4M8_9HELO|nr:natural resistance-associated macrophage protein [Hyaloscypha bicolor E]PMD57972.1 natural resistance-associated macrophage protein [Hyaloscypha bicolor E]
MFPPGTDTSGHVVVQSLPVAVEKSVSPSVQQDVSSDEKKAYNVEVLESPDSPAESIISIHQPYSQQIVGTRLQRWGAVLLKFARFTGPGTLISVAYVDPDNFQTALDAGAQFQYKLLFIILLGVLMAALATKLGCVTGLNLAQMNRAYLPRWLNYFIYAIAEAAIISTDIGQVIGTAIAINILFPKVPLVGGCAISICDTLFILAFYKADGTLRRLRIFEAFVALFIIGVFTSFCIELSFVTDPAADVFKGFLPSKEIFVSNGLFQSCAILGGILMPHSLYLGSGFVQHRMRDFDVTSGTLHEARASNTKYAITLYRPTISAIKSCMKYSIAEMCISLFVITLFVNSAILIVAANSLGADASNADLPAIYHLFVQTIGQASGTIFALALLFSGVSAGIVCTMAGQLICEGALDWRMKPFYRRLLTRSVSVIPAIIIAASEGQRGLAAALNGCNVVLSVALIFLTFPLIWYTSCKRYMRVKVDERATPLGVVDGIMNYDAVRAVEAGGAVEGTVCMANNWPTTIAAGVVWLIVTVFNVATLTFLGLGIGSEN